MLYPFSDGVCIVELQQGDQEAQVSVAEGQGKFELVGIPPSPRGVPQIDVSFEVDASGIVSVSAQDKATGREQQMRITPTSGLAPDEIEQLIEEAQGFAESDRISKEIVILRNRLDSLLRNTQKSFAKFGGMLSANDQEIANRVFKEAELSASSQGVEPINKALTSLERVAGQLTDAMMKPANESSATVPDPPGEFTKF